MKFSVGEKVFVSDIVDGRELGGEKIISKIWKFNGIDVTHIYFENDALVASIE